MDVLHALADLKVPKQTNDTASSSLTAISIVSISESKMRLFSVLVRAGA